MKSKKKELVFLTIVVLFSINFFPNASATADIYEENDTFSTAKTITEGIIYDLNLEKPYDDGDTDDFFKITVPANCGIAVQIGALDGDDSCQLSLLDSSENTLDFDDTGSPGLDVEPLNVFYKLGTVSEDIYIHVKDSELFPGGVVYYLNTTIIQDDSFEENDDSSQAFLTDGGVYENLIQMDDDYFEFFAKENTDFDIVVELDNAWGDVDLALENSTGDQLLVSTSVTSTESLSGTIIKTGTYMIRVFGDDLGTSYNLSVDLQYLDDDFEENDDFASAVELNGGFYEDLFLCDEDFYKINMNEEHGHILINASFDHNIGNIHIDLYNSSQELICEDENWDPEFSLISVMTNYTGIYYIKIFEYTMTGLKYDLFVEFGEEDNYEINNGIAEAMVISDGVYDLKLWDADYFAIITEEKYTLINFTLTTSSDQLLCMELSQYSLQDEDKGVYDLNVITLNTYEDVETYYVVVYPMDFIYEGIDYTLTVETRYADDEYEENDEINYAKTVTAGIYEGLRLIDDDVFKIELEKGDTIEITLDLGLSYSGESYHAYIFFFDSPYAPFPAKESEGNSYEIETLSYEVDEDGWYYICIESMYANGMEYTMTITVNGVSTPPSETGGGDKVDGFSAIPIISILSVSAIAIIMRKRTP